MKTLGFSVLDKSVEAFLPLFFVRGRGEALRSFTDAVQDGKHQFCKHPEDYELYYVMEFDDRTCQITCPEKPELVLRAVDAARVQAV